jgi:8-oxo-dGTP pyrophosphatase MutT (NUDIX family)
MNVVYAQSPFPESITKSIFLAGPSPRGEKGLSWRPEALKTLERLGYDGTVFVPETKEFNQDTYLDQIEWEHKALNYADIILFWIPRDLEKLPGFTTNIEFGWWMRSGKVILAAPEGAPKMGYLIESAKRFGVAFFNSFDEAATHAMKMLGDGAERQGGEIQVPLYIWRHVAFQQWYNAQKNAGNRLDGATVEWVFLAGSHRDQLYCWALHVDVWIDSERRHKTNEFVLARPDLSTVVLYLPGTLPTQTSIVLVREFRSSASTSDGFIWELPGGSAKDPKKDPKEVAAEEVFEETGLRIDTSKLVFHQARQLMGTFSAHKAHVYSYEISPEEYRYLVDQCGIAHGETSEGTTGERTYIEVRTIEEIVKDNLVDWSNLGMILSVLS